MKTIQEQLCERVYELLPEKKELEFGCEVILECDENIGFPKRKIYDHFQDHYQCTQYGAITKKDIKEIIGQPLGLAHLALAIRIATKDNDDIGVMYDFSNNKICVLTKNPLRVVKMAEYKPLEDNLLNQTNELCELCLGLLNK